MLGKLKAIYFKAQFFPGFLGLFVNPFYFARKGLLEHISSSARHIKGKALDVGCGQKPYRYLFPATEYLGLEIDSPENRANKAADYFYDGKIFPFASAEFDSLITNQVLEHVFNPAEFLREINRVLKPGGALLLTVPFVWDEHEQPWDYARYSSFGLKHLVENSGFRVIEARKSMADIRVVFQLLNAYLFKKCPFQGHYGRILYTVVLMAPMNVLGEILRRILPGNQDLYLDNIVVAVKTS